VGARHPWTTEVTRLAARRREVTQRREVLGDSGWAALAVFARLGARRTEVAQRRKVLDSGGWAVLAVSPLSFLLLIRYYEFDVKIF
jgi:predicted nicotinamide N-methyase